MSTAIRVLAVLLVVGLLAGIGISVYNAGVSQGLAQNVTAAASGAPAVVYGYPGYYGHWGFGFGFFGIFFWILGIFLIFALLRAAFGWGRWGRSRWGGYGPGGYRPGGFGGYGGHKSGHDDPRRAMLDEWHREAHGSGASEPSGPSGSGGSGGGAGEGQAPRAG
jgi:hypothetical protein